MNGKPVNDGSSPPGGIEGLYDAEQIEDIRLQMVKFARLQLSDNSLAEDVVQEAFLGALRNSASFRGQSAFKSGGSRFKRDSAVEAAAHASWAWAAERVSARR